MANNKTVILNSSQWSKCWSNMCNNLGQVPSWNQYPDYFNCVECDSTPKEGLKIIFRTQEEAMDFKLRWA